MSKVNADILTSSLFKTALIAVTATILVGAGVAVAFPRDAELLAQIDIDAPPAEIWSVLLSRPGKWQAALPPTVTEASSSGASRSMGSDVTVTPQQSIRWRRTVLFPAFLTMDHYIELQRGGLVTHFVQGESLHGAALWLYDASRLLPGLQALDLSLKKAVESRKMQKHS